MLIPGDDAHYTIMTDDFHCIAYARDCDYYLTFRQKPELRNNLILDLHMHHWNPPLNKKTPSCALALIEGNLTEIKQLCQFKIKMTQLVPNFSDSQTIYFFFQTSRMLKLFVLIWVVEQLAITLIESEITPFSAQKHFSSSTV